MSAHAAPNDVVFASPSLPWLVRRDDPFGRRVTFRLQYTLFGEIDLYFLYWRRNGSHRIRKWSIITAREAVISIYSIIERLLATGHQFTNSLHHNGHHNLRALSSFYVIVDNYLIKDQIMHLATQHNLRCLYDLIDDSNVKRIVPRTYLPFLNWSLRSTFVRDDKLLDVIFRMEDDGIIFFGDLVQLELAQIDAYTRDSKLSQKLLAVVERMRLSTNMTVRGWRRPSTFGISM